MTCVTFAHMRQRNLSLAKLYPGSSEFFFNYALTFELLCSFLHYVVEARTSLSQFSQNPPSSIEDHPPYITDHSPYLPLCYLITVAYLQQKSHLATTHPDIFFQSFSIHWPPSYTLVTNSHCSVPSWAQFLSPTAKPRCSGPWLTPSNKACFTIL